MYVLVEFLKSHFLVFFSHKFKLFFLCPSRKEKSRRKRHCIVCWCVFGSCRLRYSDCCHCVPDQAQRTPTRLVRWRNGYVQCNICKFSQFLVSHLDTWLKLCINFNCKMDDNIQNSEWDVSHGTILIVVYKCTKNIHFTSEKFIFFVGLKLNHWQFSDFVGSTIIIFMYWPRFFCRAHKSCEISTSLNTLTKYSRCISLFKSQSSSEELKCPLCTRNTPRCKPWLAIPMYVHWIWLYAAMFSDWLSMLTWMLQDRSEFDGIDMTWNPYTYKHTSKSHLYIDCTFLTFL